MKVSEALDTRMSCRAFLPDPVPEARYVRSWRGPAGPRPAATCSPGLWRCSRVRRWRPWWSGFGSRSRSTRSAIHPSTQSTRRPWGAVSYAPPSEWRGSVRHPRHTAQRPPCPPAPVRAQLRGFWRPGRAVHLHRPLHGLGPMGRHGHVHAKHHAAGTRAWAAHLPPGILVRVVPRSGEAIALPASRMLFSGIAVGYRDESAPINRLRSSRAPLAEFVGFPRLSLARSQTYRVGSGTPAAWNPSRRIRHESHLPQARPLLSAW